MMTTRGYEYFASNEAKKIATSRTVSRNTQGVNRHLKSTLSKSRSSSCATRKP